LANAHYPLSRLFHLDDNLTLLMAIFAQIFGTIFHVQQPVLMLLLSRDMRRGVRQDLGRTMKAIKNWLN
jgi:hypothetical protein